MLSGLRVQFVCIVTAIWLLLICVSRFGPISVITSSVGDASTSVSNRPTVGLVLSTSSTDFFLEARSNSNENNLSFPPPEEDDRLLFDDPIRIKVKSSLPYQSSMRLTMEFGCICNLEQVRVSSWGSAKSSESRLLPNRIRTTLKFSLKPRQETVTVFNLGYPLQSQQLEGEILKASLTWDQ